MMSGMLHRERSRAESFGAVAELYDRVRPSYPPALLDALLVDVSVVSPSLAPRVLDVGCGTGIVARLLAARGCDVLGVEIDERMARLARSRGTDVEVAQFEHWRAGGRAFDLIVSGQAWHWIDPLVGAEKAASALQPAGRLGLFWNFGVPPPAVAELFDPIYDRLAPRLDDHSVLLGGQDARAGNAIEGIAATGEFEPATTRTFSWRQTHMKSEWLDLLQTHSDHQALEPGRRTQLLAEIGDAIDSLGGSFELPYEAILVTARRR